MSGEEKDRGRSSIGSKDGSLGTEESRAQTENSAPQPMGSQSLQPHHHAMLASNRENSKVEKLKSHPVAGKFIKHRELPFTGEKLEMAISVIAGSAFLLFGYDQGVMGSLLTLPSFALQFPKTQNRYPKGEDPVLTATGTASTQSVMVAIYEIGAMLGSGFILIYGDRMGRRLSILVGAIVMIVGAIIQTTAFSYGQLVVGRIIAGLGNGMNTSTVPTWQSECAKPEKRGHLVMTEGMLIAAGIAISYWIDFGFYFAEPNQVSFRFPIAFQIFFAAFIAIFVTTLPESPRWLVMRGDYAKATNVISRLENLPEDDPRVKDVVIEIKASLEATLGTEDNPFSYKELLRMGPEQNFYRASISVAAQAFQQLSGINLITYYATVLFEDQLGFSAVKSRILSSCNGTEYWMASVVAMYLINYFSRRSMMLFGAVGMSLSMVVLTITVKFSAEGRTAAGIVAAVFLFVFNSFFAIGWLGMTWLYPAEITPLRIRVQANAISTMSNWIWNFVIVMITPPAFDTIQYRTYIIFAVFNACFVPVVYLWFPEPKGKSLEELDLVFAIAYADKKSPVTVAANQPTMRGEELDRAFHEVYARIHGESAAEQGQHGHLSTENSSQEKDAGVSNSD